MATQLTALGVQELAEVRQQLQAELQGLAESAVSLQGAASKFAAAGQAIEHLQEQEQGQSLLLPLTESLYVSGELESVDSVLLDIGTGYYVERDVPSGVDFCKRKVLLVKEKTEQLANVMRQRQEMMRQVNSVLEDKLEAEQRAAAKAGGGGK